MNLQLSILIEVTNESNEETVDMIVEGLESVGVGYTAREWIHLTCEVLLGCVGFAYLHSLLTDLAGNDLGACLTEK